MKEIRGDAKNIRALLGGAKYAIDYYQREYKWQTKQISELLDDLADKFLQSYNAKHERSAVEKYGHYFLGSIIIVAGYSMRRMRRTGTLRVVDVSRSDGRAQRRERRQSVARRGRWRGGYRCRYAGPKCSSAPRGLGQPLHRRRRPPSSRFLIRPARGAGNPGRMGGWRLIGPRSNRVCLPPE